MTVHRKRRIAADEAHSWARNLRLKNPYAKLVLGMLTLYVNGEGTCFTGIEALAEDSELSPDTVRKRLAWLEHVGAIARFPQWIDGTGRRNGEGKGKRTSDEIRLLMDADQGVIEARAAGDEDACGDADRSEISPRSQPGLNPDATTPAPPLALGQPSDSSEGLTSEPEPEPEPEDSPQPPKGGTSQGEAEGGSEAAGWPHAASWQRVETTWGDPILHQRQCRQLWSAFTEPERERFPRVLRGYLAWRLQQPKPPNRCNLQKLMRETDSWPGYEKLAGPDPALRTFIPERSQEARAFEVIALIGGWRTKPCEFDHTQACRGYWRVRPTRPDELAMSVFADKPFEQWTPLEPQTKPFYAWAERLQEWTGARPQRMRVPCLFPPHKDGSLSHATDPPPKESAA